MAKRKITNSQAICITFLWLILCYMLLSTTPEIKWDTIFILVSSAIIVFVPIYKNFRRRKE